MPKNKWLRTRTQLMYTVSQITNPGIINHAQRRLLISQCRKVALVYIDQQYKKQKEKNQKVHETVSFFAGVF